ncbi:MAG: elongation factor P [Planctomycetaceae bacterium]|nr:elongation factor P [Planctomycetales bacterium]MCB9926794.1 elongation factor P [Planctomycetaceae bacterium]
MQAKEIKPGAVVVYNDSPILIESMNVQSPSARGAATLYKFRGRNLVTKQKTDITLKGGDVLGEADFQRRPVKLMYSDATDMHFLDDQDFNEWILPLDEVGDAKGYITEGLEGMQCLIYNDECIGVQLPTTIELTITQCDPGARGNSATGRTKPATLETGLVVQVPEFIKEGERIKVDSRTAEFLSRA